MGGGKRVCRRLNGEERESLVPKRGWGKEGILGVEGVVEGDEFFLFSYSILKQANRQQIRGYAKQM